MLLISTPCVLFVIIFYLVYAVFMDKNLGFWLAIVVIGAFTFATRLSFILLLGGRQVPPLLARALRLVPPAVLSAIIFPELLRPGGTLDLSFGNPRLLAGLVAALVAWRTKNIFLTIGVGMAVLLLLQALLKG